MNGLSVTLRREKRRSTAQALLGAVERLAWIDGWIGALCLAALIVLMLTEVTLRALSNVIPGIPAGVSFTWEYCSYLMAACFTFGAAMTLRTGGHIRVNLLFGHLEPRMRKALEIAGAAIGLGSVGFLAGSMAIFTWSSFESGRTSISSGTMLWIPQLAITLGMLLFALQMLSRVLQAILDLPMEDERMKPAASLE